MNTAITRRTVLAGALSLPWPAACSPASAPAGVDCTEGTFSCRFWPGHQVRGRLARPATRSSAGARAPLAVALHGHGGDANWALVIQDRLALLATTALATQRIGLIGWSMGGDGALLVASRLGPARVATASPALWRSAADSAAGAFDDSSDFARNDVFARRSVLAAMAVRLDCGRDDPFIVANRALARELPSAVATFDAGAHTEQYWTAHAGPQMSWLAGHLT
jgi:pimeloyl-ACP methyl ester carboxylesterase